VLDVSLDVSRLVPEAQPIALAAGEVFLRHTRPWFVGVLAHGSALKGGFIPGCSDVDFQLYLEPAAFAVNGELPLALCIEIHRDLAAINPAPFRYLQCFAHPCAVPEGQVGPIPGAYAVVAGRLPVPEATAEQIRASARRALKALVPVQPALPRALLDSGEGRLQRRARLTCTEVWPALYQVLALREADAVAIWNLPKPAAIALLPVEHPLGRAIRAFDVAVRTYYPAEETVDGALEVIWQGAEFQRAVKAWWAAEDERASAEPVASIRNAQVEE
jgi:hypothetical protein